MFQLYKYIGRPSASPGDVGIEIEAEFKTRFPNVYDGPRGWSIKTDGSLRYHGLEFISKGALALDSLEENVKKVTNIITDTRYDHVPDSPRTSVHVHVNVSQFTVLDCYTALTGYWLLENLLLKHCGEDLREGAFYCRRLSDTEETFHSILQDLRSNAPFHSGHLGNRYLSQNLNSIRKHGSIEYRGMRGIYDPDIICDWAKGVFTLTRVAKEFKSPDLLLDWYLSKLSAGEQDAILDSLFPSQTRLIESLKTVPDYKSLMEETVDLIDSLAYAHDWEKWYEKFLKKNDPQTAHSNSLVGMATSGALIDPPVIIDELTYSDDDPDESD